MHTHTSELRLLHTQSTVDYSNTDTRAQWYQRRGTSSVQNDLQQERTQPRTPGVTVRGPRPAARGPLSRPLLPPRHRDISDVTLRVTSRCFFLFQSCLGRPVYMLDIVELHRFKVCLHFVAGIGHVSDMISLDFCNGDDILQVVKRFILKILI